MAAKKRAARQSSVLNRAVKAGRSALREAERRVPPDLRKQLERTFNDGQKAVHVAIKQVQTQVNRTARQADVDKVLKRLESLSKQVQEMARAAATTRQAPAPPRKAARKPATRKAAARKPVRLRLRSLRRRRGVLRRGVAPHRRRLRGRCRPHRRQALRRSESTRASPRARGCPGP
jgi:polyhydroxyalkanoate synthesis regulator phasin